MIKKIFTVFEIVCILCWIAGMFTVGAMKSFFWALPAGYGAGMIFSSWFIEKRKAKADIIGVIDSRNAPPEVKKAMDDMLKALKETGNLGDIGKKCNNPHCPACYGLAEGDDKKI